MRRSARLAALLFSACSFPGGGALAKHPQNGEMHSIDAGRDRRVYLLIEHKAGGEIGRVPIFINLHGAGASVRNLGSNQILDFTALPDMGSALVVYPQGANRRWDWYPEGSDDWHRPSGTDGESVEDIAFLRALIAELVKEHNGDPGRVYVSGISSGGFMTARVACEMGDVVTAAADIIGTAVKSELESCKKGRAMPFLLMVSTTDPNTHYTGEETFNGVTLVSALDTVAHFVRRNQCKTRAETPFPHANLNDNSTVSLISYTDCAQGAEVAFYRVDGAGHNVPVNKGPREDFRNHDIDAVAEIWGFFKRFRREPATWRQMARRKTATQTP